MNINYFGGIGGWELGFEIAYNLGLVDIKYEPNFYVDNSTEACKIYSENFYNVLPIDINNFKTNDNNLVSYVSFPCSGTSCLGKKQGFLNKESELWYKCRNIIINKSANILIEQPAFFEYNGMDEVVEDLKHNGYSIAAILLDATIFGLPHKRRRLFIAASNTDNLCELVWKKSSWTDIYRSKVERIINFTRKKENIILRNKENNGISQRLYTKFIKEDLTYEDIGNNKRWKEINLLARSIIPYQSACAIAMLP